MTTPRKLTLAATALVALGGVLLAQTVLPTGPQPAAQPVEPKQLTTKPPAPPAYPDVPGLGVAVASVPDLLRAHLPALLPPGRGLVVVRVDDKSLAADIGLKPGDILTAVNGRDIGTLEDAAKALTAGGGSLLVTVGIVHAGKYELKTALAAVHLQGLHDLLPPPRPVSHLIGGPVVVDPARGHMGGGNAVPIAHGSAFAVQSISAVGTWGSVTGGSVDGKYRLDVRFVSPDGKPAAALLHGTAADVDAQLNALPAAVAAPIRARLATGK